VTKKAKPQSVSSVSYNIPPLSSPFMQSQVRQILFFSRNRSFPSFTPFCILQKRKFCTVVLMIFQNSLRHLGVYVELHAHSSLQGRAIVKRGLKIVTDDQLSLPLLSSTSKISLLCFISTQPVFSFAVMGKVEAVVSSCFFQFYEGLTAWICSHDCLSGLSATVIICPIQMQGGPSF